MQKRRMLTEKEAAAYLGVSASLLRKWRLEGQGGPDYFKFARAVRYGEDSVESFLASRLVRGSRKRYAA